MSAWWHDRLLIADDHEVVRSGLRSIIEDHAGWSVVAEAADGKDAIAKAIATKPDVAILDHSLPLINGVQATRQIRLRVPSVEVLIFTMHDDENRLRDLLNAGARGYVLKSDAGDHLISAVQSLAAHKPYFTDSAIAALLENIPDQGTASFVTRAQCRAIGGRRAQQQADRRCAQHQHQYRRGIPGLGYAQARRYINGGPGALRRTQQYRSGIVPVRRGGDPRRRTRNSIRTRIVFHRALRHRT